ncbi:MAG: hypothetical protein ACE3JN_14560 [Ectobacillus sp.]
MDLFIDLERKVATPAREAARPARGKRPPVVENQQSSLTESKINGGERPHGQQNENTMDSCAFSRFPPCRT